MNFKNELSLRPSVLAVSKNLRLTWETCDHLFDMADNLSQSNFALRFQEIEIPSLLRHNRR